MTTATTDKAIPEFRNASKLEFQNLKNEAYREYLFFKEGEKVWVRIDKPLKLAVSESGGHRLFNEAGESIYVPPDWIELKWVAKEGAPHFDF
jgi:hypothetical protein